MPRVWHGEELGSVCSRVQGHSDLAWVTDTSLGHGVGGSVLLSRADSSAGCSPRLSTFSLWRLPLLGCSHAPQLHPAPAAADHPPGALPRSVPARCRLPCHCPSHQGSHCCPRRYSLRPTIPHCGAGLFCNSPFLMLSFLSALATLKPQAGLIVPQAVPSSQPSVVVSVLSALPAVECAWWPMWPPLQGRRRAFRAPRAFQVPLTFLLVLFRVQASQWIWANWWE